MPRSKLVRKKKSEQVKNSGVSPVVFFMFIFAMLVYSAGYNVNRAYAADSAESSSASSSSSSDSKDSGDSKESKNDNKDSGSKNSSSDSSSNDKKESSSSSSGSSEKADKTSSLDSSGSGSEKSSSTDTAKKDASKSEAKASDSAPATSGTSSEGDSDAASVASADENEPAISADNSNNNSNNNNNVNNETAGESILDVTNENDNISNGDGPADNSTSVEEPVSSPEPVDAPETNSGNDSPAGAASEEAFSLEVFPEASILPDAAADTNNTDAAGVTTAADEAAVPADVESIATDAVPAEIISDPMVETSATMADQLLLTTDPVQEDQIGASFEAVDPNLALGLAAVSPTIDPLTGFPLWYQDTNGVQLALCSDPNDPLCVSTPAITGNAQSQQSGFGDEAFYWIGTSTIDIPASGSLNKAGQALLVMGLESAYVNGAPAAGDQMVFNRLRIRVDAPVIGDYTVIHPFGSKTYTVTTAGLRAINDTIDIGAVPISASPTAFQLALTGNIGPFLTSITFNPLTDIYIGDPAVNQAVTGSPANTNFFEIIGPPGSNIGGLGIDTIKTDLFSLSGKIFVPTGVAAPVVTVSPLTTRNTTPTVTGIVSDPAAVVTVSVDPANLNLSALVAANGTWSANVVNALLDGTYNVIAQAVNAAGIGVDTTTGELIVDTTTPLATLGLSAVGPIDPTTGFPLWYQDTNGVKLGLCNDPNNPLCLATPAIPGNTLSQQTGFGPEAFYWNGTSTMDMANGGQALLVLALEAAYANGDPAPGDQMVFTRVRIRIDAPVAGDYIITHPFGTNTYTVTVPGNRAINDTIDIGIVPISALSTAFNLALNGNIGPFLTAVNPLAPASFIGDPGVNQTVTGSPLGNNLFQIAGPLGSNIGGAGIDTISTDLFTLSGRIFNEATVIPAVATIIPGAPPGGTDPKVPVGTTLQMEAVTLDQNGLPLNIVLAWTSSNLAVGTINPFSGLFTALNPGETIITAASGNVSGSSIVNVINELVPQNADILTGAVPIVAGAPGTQLNAVCFDQFGNPMAGVQMAWSNANQDVGAIDPVSGTYTPLASGTDTIILTMDYEGDIITRSETISVGQLAVVAASSSDDDDDDDHDRHHHNGNGSDDNSSSTLASFFGSTALAQTTADATPGDNTISSTDEATSGNKELAQGIQGGKPQVSGEESVLGDQGAGGLGSNKWTYIGALLIFLALGFLGWKWMGRNKEEMVG